MKTVEQIREKIEKVLRRNTTVIDWDDKLNDITGIKPSDFQTVTAEILAIEVGGEVEEARCFECDGEPIKLYNYPTDSDFQPADFICPACGGQGNLTRPKTLKDLLEAK